MRSEYAVKDLDKRLDEAVTENEGCDNIETMKATNKASIGEQLQEIKRKLQELTESLAIYEVKQDQLKIAVRLDLYIRLASEIQKLYSRAKALTYSVAQCDTNWKEEFSESIFDGLRAVHNDLTARVRDLESSQGDMSEKEKEEFKRLMRYMTGIESQFRMTQRFVEPRLNMVRKHQGQTIKKFNGYVSRLSILTYVNAKSFIRCFTCSNPPTAATLNDS